MTSPAVRRSTTRSWAPGGRLAAIALAVALGTSAAAAEDPASAIEIETSVAPAFRMGSLVAAPAFTAGTAGDESLTLARAIEIALATNHRIGTADASVAIAEAELQGARAGMKPRVDLAEIFSWSTNPTMVFANKLGQAEFGPQDFAIDTLNQPDPLTNFQTRLDVFQPVWTGGRVAAAREAAEHARDAASAGRDRTRQDVVHDVIEAYTGALLAESQLDVARESLQTARENLRMVSDLRETGMVVESDLLQAQVRESEVLEMQAQAERGVAVSRAALNLVMGRDPLAPFSLVTEIDAAGVTAADEPIEALLEEARRSRPDVTAAQSQVLAAEGAARATERAWRPEFGVLGSLEANDPDYPGASGSNWTLMGLFRFRVFDGGERKAHITGANEDVRRAREQEALLRDAAALQVVEAWHDLRTARLRLDEAGRSVSLGSESVRIVGDRYQEGLTTLVELLDAESALTRARSREVAARRDLVVSRAALDLAVGRL